MNYSRFRSVLAVTGCLIILNILAFALIRDLDNHQLLEIYFLSVGQGDSIFIETPLGHQILIDGGPDATISEKLARLLPFWDKEIDLIILTHPDRDHVAGLVDVLKRYRIDNVLWTGVVRDTLEYDRWIEELTREETNIFIAKSGQRIISKRKDHLSQSVYLDVLFPFQSMEGLKLDNGNETSIVGRLVFGENEVLLAGDISSKIERQLVDRGMDLRADILKVPHHGSKYSSSEFFLEKIAPNTAVIEVGKNSYGQPSPETLERLKKFGIDTLRTDQDGDIKIVSNGREYKIINK